MDRTIRPWDDSDPQQTVYKTMILCNIFMEREKKTCISNDFSRMGKQVISLGQMQENVCRNRSWKPPSDKNTLLTLLIEFIKDIIRRISLAGKKILVGMIIATHQYFLQHLMDNLYDIAISKAQQPINDFFKYKEIRRKLTGVQMMPSIKEHVNKRFKNLASFLLHFNGTSINVSCIFMGKGAPKSGTFEHQHWQTGTPLCIPVNESLLPDGTKLIFVRHGEAFHNVTKEKLLDSHLTDAGYEELLNTCHEMIPVFRENFKDCTHICCCTSPLDRTILTGGTLLKKYTEPLNDGDDDDDYVWTDLNLGTQDPNQKDYKWETRDVEEEINESLKRQQDMALKVGNDS